MSIGNTISRKNLISWPDFSKGENKKGNYYYTNLLQELGFYNKKTPTPNNQIAQKKLYSSLDDYHHCFSLDIKLLFTILTRGFDNIQNSEQKNILAESLSRKQSTFSFQFIFMRC